jgi:hypothetical protein
VQTIRTTRVEDVVAAVEVVEADEVVAADVDKAQPDVVEAVVDVEKLIRALLLVVRTLVIRTLPPKIPPLMGRMPTRSFC